MPAIAKPLSLPREWTSFTIAYTEQAITLAPGKDTASLTPMGGYPACWAQSRVTGSGNQRS